MADSETLKAHTMKLSSFLGLQRGTVGVLAMVVLVGMGERMAERFLPIYMLALGGGAMAIGLLQAMDNFLSALYSFPGGHLSDRIGTKKSLLIFNLVAMCGFALVLLIPTWQAVLVGAVLFISWTAISLPATMNLIYNVLPKNKRTMGVSMHSLVRSIPMALGPLAGGFFISIWGERDGVGLAIAAALIMAAAALLMQQIMIETEKSPKAVTCDACGLSPQKNSFKLLMLMNPSMKRLLVTDILVRYCEQIPYAFVVVWCMKIISEPVSALQFGVLTTIEMATAVLVFIPDAYLADRSKKKPFVAMTFFFFSLFPLVLLFSQSLLWLIPAFVLRGLKEFGEPTRKALIMVLCPDNCKAGMFGLYYLIGDIFVAIFYFKVSFPYIVAAAVLGGLNMQRWVPEVFCKGHFDTQTRECSIEVESGNGMNSTRPTIGHVAKVFAVCLALWAIPMGTIGLWRVSGDTLTQIGLFFTKAAFVTFGGAYAVLSYITEVAVSSGWLSTQQMLIGLGLAESTPGPLIMVTQYAGFLAAWNLPGELSPLAAGILGALLTTYVTFLPCFFFIFAGAPFIESMAGNQRLQAALTGVTAAVVGVVLKLAVWFGVKVIWPNGTMDLFAIGAAIVSLVLLVKFHVPIHWLVPAGALAGVLRQFLLQY